MTIKSTSNRSFSRKTHRGGRRKASSSIPRSVTVSPMLPCTTATTALSTEVRDPAAVCWYAGDAAISIGRCRTEIYLRSQQNSCESCIAFEARVESSGTFTGRRQSFLELQTQAWLRVSIGTRTATDVCHSQRTTSSCFQLPVRDSYVRSTHINHTPELDQSDKGISARGHIR